MSVFSSNLNVFQAWNSCLGVLLIFKYCHLNLFCKVGQSSSNGASNSYHNLPSPINVKQKCLTLSLSGKLCASIQSLVLRRWDSASSSGFTENSGFFPIQFLSIIWGMGTTIPAGASCTGTGVVVAELVYFDKPVWDLKLEFELQELEWEFDLQGPEPDFDLWDQVLYLQIDLDHLD